MTQTPLQQAIEMFKSEMKGIEENPMIDRDEKLAYSSQYEDFIERLESLLPKEKEFAEKCWDAGGENFRQYIKHTESGTAFTCPDKTTFINQLYPEK